MLALILIPIYVIFLILGFKSTWKLVSDLISGGGGDLLFTLVLFVIAFIIIGPIMGIIALVKYIILFFVMSKDKKV